MNDEQKHQDGTAEDVEGHAMFRPDEDEMFGDDTAGHGIDAHASRPGHGPDVGGKAHRFRPDEDEMFGDDVEGHGLRGGDDEAEDSED